MATKRRTSRSTVGESSQYGLLGVVGRKTGIMPKANVLKDADDMDNVEDWFASSDEEMADEIDEEMVESFVGSDEKEGELSFIRVTPPSTRTRGLSILDQSLLQSVTPIRPVRSKGSVAVSQESPASPPPFLDATTPSPVSEVPTKAASKQAKTAETKRNSPPLSKTKSKTPSAAVKKSPEPAIEPAEQGDVSGFADTSGYSEYPEQPQPSSHCTTPSSPSSIDSVRAPPPPKVLRRDSTSREVDETATMEMSEETNVEESRRAPRRGTTKRAASAKRRKEETSQEEEDEPNTVKRTRKHEEEEDAMEENEEVPKAGNDKTSGKAKGRAARGKKGANMESEISNEEQTGKASKGKKRSTPHNEEEQPEESDEEKLLSKRNRHRAKASPPEDSESDKSRTKASEQRRKDGKSKAPSTPSPPASPVPADPSFLRSPPPAEATIPGSSEPSRVVPLKDHSASMAKSTEESKLDLTNYDEMPTYVDPDDTTWLANDSLEEEAANLSPVRRSSRKRLKPLAYWKNERVLYGYQAGEDMRSVTGVVHVKTPTNKKHLQKKKTSGKGVK